MSSETSTRPAETYLFPPALVRLVRERAAPSDVCLLEVSDRELVQLFTTIFFAGLETYEGEHHPISVAFLGRSPADYVMSDDTAVDMPPLYQWKIMRFASPRPFTSREFVKLAVAGGEHRIYTAVGVLEDGALAITGLAREGVHIGADPFIRIIASRPGCLSIRGGRELAIEYERGVVVTVGDDALFAAGPVHRALETIARSGGIDAEIIGRYVDAIGSLVREIVAHGHGGILIISPDERPRVPESAPYHMALDFSLGALLRLAWRVGHRGDHGNDRANPSGRCRTEHFAFGALLCNAFLGEAERVIEELGRLTAIDGAVLLNRALALVAFGVILPVRQSIRVVEASHADTGIGVQEIDFGSRGTRHRAAATYAAEHPGSVVFIASEDGQVLCLLCERDHSPVGLWRLMTGAVRT